MANDIGELTLTVKVNKDTGQLEVLKSEVKDLGVKVNDLAKSPKNAADTLTASLGRLASQAAIIATIKQAVQESVQEAEALRILSSQMDAVGLSFKQSEPQIKSWAESMQELAHLEDGQVYESLGKSIQRTKDLATSMKLVQLSQDVAVGTGKDFNNILDSLSRAAGGSQRGLMQLKLEFGAQLANVKTNKDAIDALVKSYGGMAIKTKNVVTDLKDVGNKFKDIAQDVGDRIVPKFQEMIGLLDFNFIARIGTAIGTITSVLLSGLTNAGKSAKIIISTVADALVLTVTGRFAKAKETIAVGLADLVTQNKKASEDIKEAIKKGLDDIDGKYKSHGEKRKKSIQELKDIHVQTTKSETQDILQDMDRRIELLNAAEQLALVDKSLSEQQRISIIKDTALQEVSIVYDTAQKTGEMTQEMADKITQIWTQQKIKVAQINQAGVENWKQGLTDYVRHANNVNARVADVGKKAFDDLSSAFGQSTAKMIFEGKNFTETFEALFKNMAEQIVAELVTIIAKIFVLKTLLGGSLGNSLGLGGLTSVIGLAEGGRVTSPTLAVIGEGGEGETVVPDSKAKSFAMGVLAGDKNTSTSSSSSNSQNISMPINIYMNVSVNSLSSSERGRILEQLADEASRKTSSALRAAVALKDAANSAQGRAQ